MHLDDLAARLDRLAALLDRPRSWLIEQAGARYGEEETHEVSTIVEAHDQYRRGEGGLTPHEEVMREAREHIRARRRPEQF